MTDKDCRIFEAYTKTIAQQNVIVGRRGSMQGIAVEQDQEAREWQSIDMRREMFESYLRGASANWYCATWLPLEEMERRTMRAREQEK